MKPIDSDFYSKRLPADENLRRDTKILTGSLTDADRTRINKAWNRATKLGAMKVIQIEMRRNEKRGFELS